MRSCFIVCYCLIMINTNSLKNLHVFKDKQGHIVIWQWPNVPLYGWLVFKLLSLAVHVATLKHGFDNLSMAFLFVWAYLEITSGVNYFRRALGLIVMIFLMVGYFQ